MHKTFIAGCCWMSSACKQFVSHEVFLKHVMSFKGHAVKSCMPQEGLISLVSLTVYCKEAYHIEGTFKNI